MLKKNVLITGASKGIGRALAEKFATEGHTVIATARDPEKVKLYSDALPGITGKIIPAKLDVTIRGEVEEFIRSVEKDYPVDCLINNAGITSFKRAEHDSFDQIEQIVNTNLVGAVYMIKNVLPGMIRRKEGNIINIISVAADKIFTNSSIYAATKAGLLTYAKVLREEVRGYGISVINVLPGATRTDIWSSEMLQKFGDRMMDPEHIANVVYSAINSDNNLVQEEIVIRPLSGDL